jgi:uncharacterized membrane protein YdjX (TVP38/TMEM64 family)
MNRYTKKIFLLVLFLALILATWRLGGDTLTFEKLQKNSEQLRGFVEAHYLLSVAAFIGIDLLTAFFLPGALVLTLAGGFLFGVIPGTAFVMTGMVLGAALAFLFVRYLAGNWIHSRYENQLETFNMEISRHGSNYLVMLRIIPVLPFFAVNFLAGMTRMSLKRYVLTTAIGVLPGTFVYTYAGQQLGTISSPEEILSPRLLIAFILLGTLALVPVILRFTKRELPHKHHDGREE